MAPFITHFLIAEQIWPDLDGPWHSHYGQFCFGCVAPDVDKLSDSLTQKDTHFFDKTTDYELMVTQRSVCFIEGQPTFLEQRFVELSPAGQAFVLGYLCHLCVDEVSKDLWREETTWSKIRAVSISSAFAALDDMAKTCINDYQRIRQEMLAIRPIPVIRPISEADLQAMFKSICNLVDATTVEGQFLAVMDMFDQPSAVEREQLLTRFCQEVEIARRQLFHFKLDELVSLSIKHSHSRIQALIQGQVPEVSYPFSLRPK